jgi:Undecaprenyl-phosphate galactose phosphotransferase WbaP
MNFTELRLPALRVVAGSRQERRLAARAARLVILAACDLAALFAAGSVAYLLWALPERGQSLSLYLQIAPYLLLFTIGYAQAGLYPGLGLGPVETLRRLTYVTLVGFLLLAAFTFALRLPPLYSRATFGLTLLVSLVSVPAFRGLLLHFAHRWQWWSEPVVVVGAGERALRVIQNLQHGDGLGYRPVAVIAFGLGESAVREVAGVPVVGGLDEAGSLADRGIRIALVETRRADPARERTTIDRLHRVFRHVVLIREYDDLPVEGLQIRNLGNLVGIEYSNNLIVPRNQVLKRMLDVITASLAIVLAVPVIAVCALLVRLIDGAPSFFVQRRQGLDGRRIVVPKIRTMRRDAEERLEESLARDPALRKEWETSYKLKADPRLLPGIGRTLRQFSIDELPQLWSVLRGDMSMVGPRPFPDYHLNEFSPAFQELRRRVRPGITGLWQITIRSAGGTAEQESYDSYYIRNWSVWLDLWILSRTLVAVASGRGAY